MKELFTLKNTSGSHRVVAYKAEMGRFLLQLQKVSKGYAPTNMNKTYVDTCHIAPENTLFVARLQAHLMLENV